MNSSISLRTFLEETLHLGKCGDTGTGSHPRTLQGCHRGPEFEPLLQVHIVQQTIQITGVIGVTGAGCIDILHSEGLLRNKATLITSD